MVLGRQKGVRAHAHACTRVDTDVVVCARGGGETSLIVVRVQDGPVKEKAADEACHSSPRSALILPGPSLRLRSPRDGFEPPCNIGLII